MENGPGGSKLDKLKPVKNHETDNMAKKWKLPPRIKVLEALGAVADGRIETEGNRAKVISSLGRKRYTVVYQPENSRIFSNDNASRWQGYLGYPIIAFLFAREIIEYKGEVAEALKGIKWKKLNDKYKDYDKVEEIVKERCEERGVSKEKVEKEQKRVMERLKDLDLKKTWRRIEVEKLE